MLWEISLLIIAITIFLLVIFAIPTLLQMRRTAKSMELTATSLNQNLPGILTNLDEITTNLTHTTQSIHDNVDGLKNVVVKFQDMADDVVQFEKQIRAEIEVPIIETISSISAVVKGTRAFFDALRVRR